MFFNAADLSGANLNGARLLWTNLTATILDGMNLTQANLTGAVFGSTNLKHVQGLESCNHHGPSIIDYETLAESGRLPSIFLQGCGFPDKLIDYLPSLLNDPIQFYSCFISYNHADKVFARRLHDTLQGHGIRCWLDEKQIYPADDIHDEMDREIRLWDKVLLCCSSNSLRSWWVDNETTKAFLKEQKLMKERKKKVLALIPLDLDGYLFSGNWNSGKASEVQERLAGNFVGWEQDNSKYETEVKKVVIALAH